MKSYRLREIRVNRGYKQKEIADLINVSRETYSMYETGKIDPRAEVIIKLSRIYNLSSDYILGLVERPESLSDRNKTIIKPERQEGM